MTEGRGGFIQMDDWDESIGEDTYNRGIAEAEPSTYQM